MRIGLIEAETLPDKVIAEFGSYGNMFERLLAAEYPDWTFCYYQAEQGELPSADDCDAFIITGSRFSAYDQEPWINALKEWIRTMHRFKKPCLGICFGHQIIAEALGGKVAKSEQGWGVGASEFNILAYPPWMTTTSQRFTILVSHQDQVIKRPAGSDLFASSVFCPIGGFYIDNHIFCLQGHPEFEIRYLQRLINKRRAIIGEEKSDKALISMENFEAPGLGVKLIGEFLNAAVLNREAPSATN